MNWRVMWSWRAGIIVAAFIAAIAINDWFIRTGYEAKCVTERAQFRLGPQESPSWHLDGALLLRDAVGKGEPFTGTFQAAPNATVTFERIGKGPLNIGVAAPGDGIAATVRPRGGRDENLGPSVYLTIDNLSGSGAPSRNAGVVFPINGAAEIGNLLSDETSAFNPIQRSGTVRMLGRTFVGNSIFDAGSRDLSLGDFLTFQPESDGVGLLSANEDNGIAVVYRVVAKAAVVQRFRAEEYRIRVALYSRIAGDTSLQLIWAAILAFVSGFRFVAPQKLQKSSARSKVGISHLLESRLRHRSITYGFPHRTERRM